jgi:biotin operon repressor
MAVGIPEMNCTDIYRNTLSHYVKPRSDKEELDPDFLKFRSQMEPIRYYKVYALWWVSKKFRSYWCGDDLERLIWTCCMYELSSDEILHCALAWFAMRKAHPNLKSLNVLIKQKMDEASPTLRRRAQFRNKRRREQYSMNRERYQANKDEINRKRRERYKMKQGDEAKRGRPVQENGLRTRIKEVLARHPSTRLSLVAELNVSDNTLKDALKRLRNAGEIVTLVRGFYALPSNVEVVTPVAPAPQPEPAEVPEPKPIEPTPAELRDLFRELNKIGSWSREKFTRFLQGGPEYGNGYPHMLSLIGIETDGHTCCRK